MQSTLAPGAASANPSETPLADALGFSEAPGLAPYPASAREGVARFSLAAAQLAWACSLFRECMLSGKRPSAAEHDLPPPRLSVETSGNFVFFLFSQVREKRHAVGPDGRELAGSPMLIASLCARLAEWHDDGVSIAHECSRAMARLEAAAREEAQALLDWRPGAPHPSLNAAQAKARLRRDGSKLLAEALALAGFKARKSSISAHDRAETLQLSAPASLPALGADARAVALALRSLRLLAGDPLARVEAALLSEEMAEARREQSARDERAGGETAASPKPQQASSPASSAQRL